MLKYAPDYLKIENRKKIFDLFVKDKELSRAEIVRRTDMSFPTASKAVDYLISRNIVIENDLIPGKGGLGRKSRLLHLNTKSYYGASVVFEGNFVEYGIVNLAGELVKFDIYDNSDIRDPKTAQKAADGLNGMMEEYGDRILGVGVGIPGAVDQKKKVILNSSQMGLTDVPFDTAMRSFTEKIKLPIYIDNDVNLACEGEMYATAATRPHDSLVYIYMGTGIGSGICVDGQILQGCTNRGGEFEDSIIALGDGPDKNIRLGQKISAEAIKKNIGIDFSKDNDLSDADIDKAVDYLVPYLAVEIGNIALFLDINEIVIAGIIPAQLGERFYKKLNGAVNELRPYDGWKININGPSEDGNALIGGASIVFENTILSENGKAN